MATRISDADLPPKDRLDHLGKLADDRWREYDHKSQAEWKLSYAIWATLLAATTTLITNTTTITLSASQRTVAATIFFVAATAIHWGFLCWIHKRLRARRIELDAIWRKRARLLDVKNTTKPGDRTGRRALAMQLFITVLLGALLIFMAAQG